MELVNGGTAVRITLGSGVTNTSGHLETGTMQWTVPSEVHDTSNAPFCIGCTVWESVIPWVDPISGDIIDDEDREF